MSSEIVVLDAGAVEAMADPDLRTKVWKLAQRDWTVVIPTVVLAECLTGTDRDATANRVIGQFATVMTTEPIARTAAALRYKSDRTTKRRPPGALDAIVAAHAIHLEALFVLTSDVGDLRRLLANRPDIGVERA